MPTRNVNLTEELDRFVATRIESGRYDNASEVVRAALRTLEREEQEYEARIALLRAAIDEGDASGIALGDVVGRVRKKLAALDKGRSFGNSWKYSRRAETDLLNISKFKLGEWGLAQADRYLTELVDCCQRLAENPLLGRTSDPLRPGLRRMEQGKHVVFYRQQGKGILVSSVLHGSMLALRHPMDEDR